MFRNVLAKFMYRSTILYNLFFASYRSAPTDWAKLSEDLFMGMSIKYDLETFKNDTLIETFYNSLESNVINSIIKEKGYSEWYLVKSKGNIFFQVIELENGNFVKQIIPVRCRFNDTNIYFSMSDDDLDYSDLYLNVLSYAEDFDCSIPFEIICNCYDEEYFDRAEKEDERYIRSKEFIDVIDYQEEGKTLYIEKPYISYVDQEDIKKTQTYFL